MTKREEVRAAIAALRVTEEEAMQKETYRGATLINRTRRWDGWHVTENGRTRWGTLREVQADVDHLLIWGHLPESKNGWA